MDAIVKILKEIKYPFAYDHFAEGEKVKPPFICYVYPKTDNFSADGKVYYEKTKVQIELYTDKKDLSAEKKVSSMLTKYGFFYNKSEVWIPKEHLYQVIYEAEV